jgi:hypothetical protein
MPAPDDASTQLLPRAAILALALIACGSAAPTRPVTPAPTGGTSGAPTGGSAGTPTGGSMGTGGTTGGTGGSVGAGGNGGSTISDASPATGGAPATTDGAMSSSDGPTVVTTDGGGIPGHEWVIPCDPKWTKEQCCAHYCTCMTTNCPDRAPANCMATCTSPGNNWNLKCKVEQCFESLDPRYPMDKGSHCGHATEAAHCQGIIP